MNHLNKITQEFKAIKKALNANGYLTRKEPTYPKWRILASHSRIYFLSYSATTRQWNLSGKASECDRLWQIIQKALGAEVSQ
jgi:hypothetical protein